MRHRFAGWLRMERPSLAAGALPWLKDPFDPEGEPLQQVLDSSVFLQLQRELVSLASMSCLAVLLVSNPIPPHPPPTRSHLGGPAPLPHICTYAWPPTTLAAAESDMTVESAGGLEWCLMLGVALLFAGSEQYSCADS